MKIKGQSLLKVRRIHVKAWLLEEVNGQIVKAISPKVPAYSTLFQDIASEAMMF